MTDGQSRQATSMAIEVMTAMFAEPSSTNFALERVGKMSEAGGRETVNLLCAGLITLCGSAIGELARQTQVPELKLLQRFSLNLQQRDG